MCVFPGGYIIYNYFQISNNFFQCKIFKQILLISEYGKIMSKMAKFVIILIKNKEIIVRNLNNL